MENKSHAIAAGAFVLGLVAVLVALVLWVTRDSTVRHVYELSTRDAVSGLQPQAMVRYRGIAVGRVAAIDFDPLVKGNVRVRIKVDERVPLTTSSFATLSYQGVTGLAFIALDDKGESQVLLQPNNANPPRIPLRPSLLAQWQAQGESIVSRVNDIADKVNSLVGDDNQQRIADALENIAAAAAGANQLTKSLDHTIQTGLNPALKALPPLVERTHETMGAFKAAATDASQLANNLNASVTRLSVKDGPIDRLGDGTKALSQAVESFNHATLPRVNRVADDTARAVRGLGRAADGISDNPQSLLFGHGGAAAGPGEPGFSAPTEPAATQP